MKGATPGGNRITGLRRAVSAAHPPDLSGVVEPEDGTADVHVSVMIVSPGDLSALSGQHDAE
jgi:hypothetical protein